MKATSLDAGPLGIGLRVLLSASLVFGSVPVQALAEAVDAAEDEIEIAGGAVDEAAGDDTADPQPVDDDASGGVATGASDDPEVVVEEGDQFVEPIVDNQESGTDVTVASEDGELVDNTQVDVGAADAEEPGSEEGEAPAAEAEEPAAVVEEEPASEDVAEAGEVTLAAEEPPALAAQATKAYSISKAKVSGVGTKRWTSKAITPKPTVKYGRKTLKLGRDYTLSYKNNVKPGTATITVTGKGSYTGSRRVTFTIKKVGTWRHYAAGWRYVYAKGVWAKGKFLKIDGKVYRFDKDGIMLTGWRRLKADGKWWWYYFGPDGAMRTGWQSVGGKWYWFSKYGRMATGLRSIGGKKYYLGSDGAMRTGWQRIGKRWYYFYGSGAMAKSCWVGYYYLGKNGAMLTNTVTPDGYRVLSNGRWDGKGKVGTVSTAAFSVTLPSEWGSSVSTGAMDRLGYRKTSVDNLVVFHWARNSDYTGYTSFRGGMMRIATKKGPTYTVDVYMTYSPWGGEAMEHHTPDSSDNAAVSKLTGGKYGSPSTFGTTQFDASMQYAKQYVKKNIADKLVVK